MVPDTFYSEFFDVWFTAVPSKFDFDVIARAGDVDFQAGSRSIFVFFWGKPLQFGRTNAFIGNNRNRMLARHTTIVFSKGGKCELPARAKCAVCRSLTFGKNLYKALFQRFAVKKNAA